MPFPADKVTEHPEDNHSAEMSYLPWNSNEDAYMKMVERVSLCKIVISTHFIGNSISMESSV